MEGNVSSLREDLSSLNDSVSNLSMCLQEHKQQTAAELAQLQTSLNTTQSSLVNNNQQVNQRLDTVNSKLEVLNASLSQHQQQTAAELAQLQTLNTSLTISQSSLESKLDTMTATTTQLSTNVRELHSNISAVVCADTEESLQLHQNLLNNFTHQLETIQDYVEQPPVHTCGGTGGWRRVVYLDMTDPSTTCPSGWNMTGYSKRTCGRASDSEWYTCDSVTFSVVGQYSRVCGQIRAYQWGSTHAFTHYQHFRQTTIDDAYVDGVSMTHGTPREHIWTFAAGASEAYTFASHYACPCDTRGTVTVPSFVGENYFCESGVNEGWTHGRHWSFHPNDTLWDGENCLSSSTCCSLHNPPYFVRQLPKPTTDDIEVRICLHHELLQRPYPLHPDIAIELLELYVQ